jgi:hypothetical protein
LGAGEPAEKPKTWRFASPQPLKLVNSLAKATTPQLFTLLRIFMAAFFLQLISSDRKTP